MKVTITPREIPEKRFDELKLGEIFLTELREEFNLWGKLSDGEAYSYTQNCVGPFNPSRKVFVPESVSINVNL